MLHPHKYKTVYIKDNGKALKKCNKLLRLAKEQTFFGLDIETTYKEGYEGAEQAGLSPYLSRIRLIQIACEQTRRVYVFDMFHVSMEILLDLLSTGRFFSHNAFFEQQHLLRFTREQNISIYCTMVMYLMFVKAKRPNPSAYRANLAEVVKQTLKIDTDDYFIKTFIEPYIAKLKNTNSYHPDKSVELSSADQIKLSFQKSDWSKNKLSKAQIEYASLDASYCYTVGVALATWLRKRMPQILKINMQSIAPLSRMMNNGVYLNPDAHLELIDKWEDLSSEAIDTCFRRFGAVNFKSSMKLNEWLVENVPKETLEMWPRTDSGKNYKTDHNTLMDFSYIAGIKDLCEYKKYTKLLSTYGKSLLARINPRTGRLHCSYTLGYTTTGRLSSRNPNLQNLPRDGSVRNNFCHQRKDTVLICADYSQIELRCAAIVSQDSAMLSAYENGEDLHLKTAATMTGKSTDDVTKDERQLAKAVNFGLLFGMGPTKLRLYSKVSYGVEMSEPDAYKAVEAFRTTYPEYRRWQNEIAAQCERSLSISTVSGMIRKLSDKNYYTCSMNTPVQGAAAEIMNRAIIRIDRDIIKKNLNAKLILTVHDEVIVETLKPIAKKVKRLVENQMTKAYHDIFPGAPARDLVEASIGNTWQEAK